MKHPLFLVFFIFANTDRYGRKKSRKMKGSLDGGSHCCSVSNEVIKNTLECTPESYTCTISCAFTENSFLPRKQCYTLREGYAQLTLSTEPLLTQSIPKFLRFKYGGIFFYLLEIFLIFADSVHIISNLNFHRELKTKG